jgi:cbb3-type cytochrome oxidase maturation protein
MTALAWLIPAALCLGALGLAGFLWSLKSGQFDDLEGAGWRALDDDPGLLPQPADEKPNEG